MPVKEQSGTLLLNIFKYLNYPYNVFDIFKHCKYCKSTFSVLFCTHTYFFCEIEIEVIIQ